MEVYIDTMQTLSQIISSLSAMMKADNMRSYMK